jgi:hypothetical protein
MSSSGMLHRVALVRTDVLEELSTSTIRVTSIGEVGTTLAVTSNRRTLFAPSISHTAPVSVKPAAERKMLLRRATRRKVSVPSRVLVLTWGLSRSPETSVGCRRTDRCCMPVDDHRRKNPRSYNIHLGVASQPWIRRR